MISQTKKAATTNKCTYFAGHFAGHADLGVQCRAHCPQQQDLGYPICHQTPPLGKYLPHIDPTVVMVINFGSKKLFVVL
jgi:hypothetical protein